MVEIPADDNRLVTVETNALTAQAVNAALSSPVQADKARDENGDIEHPRDRFQG